MNAYSTLIPAEDGERPGFGQTAASAMSLKWSALHDAAGVAAMLAGITVESSGPEVRDFPAAVRKAAGWRRDRKAESSKRWASKAANFIRDSILKDDCPDTGCGIKASAFHTQLHFSHAESGKSAWVVVMPQ